MTSVTGTRLRGMLLLLLLLLLVGTGAEGVAYLKPWNVEYHKYTTLFNHLPDIEGGGLPFALHAVRKPVVREFAVPRTVEEVVEAVGKYRGEGVRPRIKSGGGHSYAGWSMEHGGATIALREMREFAFDAAEETLTVGAGWQWGEVYHKLEELACPDVDGVAHQYVVPGGSCPTVGVAGYTLGGGHSSLSRSHGLGVDALVGMDVVLANGTVVRCSEGEHADLFWAVRGGSGGNFGVTVSLRFKLSKIPRRMAYGVLRFNTLWNAAKRERLLHKYAAFVEGGMPRTMSLYVNCDSVTMKFFYTSVDPDPSRGHLEFARFIETVEDEGPQDDKRDALLTGTFMDYERLIAIDPLDEIPVIPLYFQSALVTALSPATASAFAHEFPIFYISSVGGAVADVPANATAYPYREALFALVSYTPVVLGTRDVDAARDGMDRVVAAAGASHLGPYVNYVDPYMRADFMPSYFGANAPRLREVKARYDPTNFWRYPQSIPLPSPSTP